MKIAAVFILLVSATMAGVKAHPGAAAKLSVNIVNLVNGEPLVLNERIYRLGTGDSVFISAYKYYISNIQLQAADGKEFHEEESYRLINEGRASSKKFEIHVPQGKYTSIRFMIGVDSLHNVSGAQTDALDPINAMFWDWNTGYIMAKLEGKKNDAEQSEFSFHIGGYAGKNNTTRWVILKFATPIIIKEGGLTAIELRSDIAEWFKTPYKVDITQTPVIATEGGDAIKVADNYADMFSLSHVE